MALAYTVDMDAKSKRVALVTGGAGGIGSAVSRRLAANGLAVAIHCHKSAAKAIALAREIQPDCPVVVEADLSDTDGATAAVSAARKRLGAVDVLVHTAGGYLNAPLLDTNPDDFEAMWRIDTLAALRLIQAVVPDMIERGSGRLVFISTVAADRHVSGEGAYAACKAAVEVLTRAAAAEFGPWGITVNAVAPALTLPATKADGSPIPNPPLPAEHPGCAAVPDRRPGHADEVAALIAWLASDAASHITGQVIAIDGGLSAVSPPAR
jgi:NAD(P)-dependent dehydrogenase (short-subunit alcohol dehydrogenase family)